MQCIGKDNTLFLDVNAFYIPQPKQKIFSKYWGLYSHCENFAWGRTL